MHITSKRRLLAIAAVPAAALLLSACHFAGSGTVESASGHGTAAFSFDLDCPAGGTLQSGALTYVDSPEHVSLHGTVTGVDHGSTCSSNAGSYGEGDFSGTYTALNHTGSGTFALDVTVGRTGTGYTATFSITLSGGPYDGYTNCGPVLAGQVQTIGGPNA